MKDLRHDNLNSFIGACVEPEQIRIVSEYCTRGSLRYSFWVEINTYTSLN